MNDDTFTSPATEASGDPNAAPAAAPGPLLVAIIGDDKPVITAARLLAERLGSAPEVITVWEPTPPYLPGLAADATLPEREAEQRGLLLDGVRRVLRSTLGGDPGWPVEIVDGSPARAIASVGRARRARLILMGIGRHAPLDRVFGSETTLQTIRMADRPVLAVAPSFIGLPRRAVVAVDFSPASVRAAEDALAMLAEGGALSLVHVRPRYDDLRGLREEAAEWRHGERVSDLFEHLIAGLRVPPSVTVGQVVLAGDASEQVIELAQREGADLIAVGGSGLGFLDRMIVGSVATRILRRSTVSVLALPRPSAADVERIERQLATTVEASESARWPAMLEAFSERNAGRPTQLEIEDPAIGVQLQQSGYTLLGISYDRRDRRLEIMLGAPEGGGAHLTHTISGVTSVAVRSNPHQRDLALQATHGRGRTILTFRD